MSITEKKPLVIQIPGERTPNELPVSASAGSVFITAFDGIVNGGISYNNRISSTMTTLIGSASFNRVT